VVLPAGDPNHVGCLPDQVQMTRALNEELDQARMEIRKLAWQKVEAQRKITNLESICK
jgi:hypothetical protein